MRRNMREWALAAKGMEVGYDKKPFIKNIEIRVRPGEILTLIGPNGSGKSTILKSLIGQLELLGGRVYLGERDMKGMSPGEIARTMSILMTQRPSPELMTCGEVAETGRYPYTGRLGMLRGENRRKVCQAMEMVGAEKLYDFPFLQASDGQRQRVLLARAICQDPDVIVMDEPTSFLDIRGKLEFLELIVSLAREKKTAVILSLHELDLAQKISDRVLCIRDRRVDRYGTPEEIFQKGYMEQLFRLQKGSYNPDFGSLELAGIQGQPSLFVIGGNGSGIETYRRLRRQAIPFAVGILQENDVDYPVASALAVRVVSEKAYEPMGEKAYKEAKRLMESCGRVVCCLNEFGTVNEMNRRLAQLAREKGWL